MIIIVIGRQHRVFSSHHFRDLFQTFKMEWVSSLNIKSVHCRRSFWEQRRQKQKPVSSLFDPAERSFLNSEYFEPIHKHRNLFRLNTL